MSNPENFISRIPASALQEGFADDPRRSVSEKNVLDTKDFHSMLSEKHQMPDLSMTMKDSFGKFIRGYLTNSTMKLLDRFVPSEEKNPYREINEYLYENLATAKELLNERLVEASINEKQVYERVLAGESLDPELQFVVSQIHEYAWYLTLFNYRYVFKIAKKNTLWEGWNEHERQDFLHSCLIGSWNLACRFDPQRGNFVNYLNASLPGVSKAIHFEYLEGSKYQDENYIHFYKVANKLLGELKVPSQEECTMLASLLHDESNGKVTFPREKIVEALQEYRDCLYGQRDPHNEADPSMRVLEWIRPYQNFRQTVKKRCVKIVTICNLTEPLSLDRERYIRVKNPEASGHKFIKYKIRPVSMAKGPEEVVIDKETKQKLAELMKRLSKREREILQLRLGLGGLKIKTLDEIGEIYGITREAVRLREKSAIRRLQRSGFYYREMKFGK